MSDPAIEAAQRAALSGPYAGCCKAYANTAAREALKPIRELHQKRTARAIGFGDMPDKDFCSQCSNIGLQIAWPCPTAKLVYTTEELS